MNSEKGQACVVVFALVCFIILLAVVFGIALGVISIYCDAGILGVCFW